MLALGITVILPSAASATVVGWIVTDWCAPHATACDPARTYYQGMPIAMFKANAGRNCATAGFGNENSYTTPRSGYLNPPDGIYSSPAFKDLRWIVGDPVWCSNDNSLAVPFRYFSNDPVGQWRKNAWSGVWGLGANVPGYSGLLTVECLASNGTTLTSVTHSTGAGGGAWQGATGTNHVGTGLFGPNFASKTLDASKSYQRYNFVSTSPINTLLNNPTACAFIVRVEVEIPLDTLGAKKTVQWSGARAMSGQPNKYSPVEKPVNCSGDAQPFECIGQDQAPFVAVCGAINILDSDTWGNLGPCLIGTPADYMEGATVAPIDGSSLPLPGTGTCAPLEPGDILGYPLTIDLCGWYPTVRPMIDVLMTAGLWIAVAGAVMGTRTTGGDS